MSVNCDSFNSSIFLLLDPNRVDVMGYLQVGEAQMF